MDIWKHLFIWLMGAQYAAVAMLSSQCVAAWAIARGHRRWSWRSHAQYAIVFGTLALPWFMGWAALLTDPVTTTQVNETLACWSIGILAIMWTNWRYARPRAAMTAPTHVQ